MVGGNMMVPEDLGFGEEDYFKAFFDTITGDTSSESSLIFIIEFT
jgi:hypothetical protein